MEWGSRVSGVLVLIGFTATIAQVVLLRELMAVFSGNEISIGFMLAAWLFWTALGSSLAGRLSRCSFRPHRVMAALQVLVALTLPAAVAAVRSTTAVLKATPGESLGPGMMLLASLLALGPFCMLSGALFTTGSRLIESESALPAGTATGSVYLWEAIGSSIGGILAGVLLVRLLGSIEIAALLGSLNLLAASTLAFPKQRLAAAFAVIGISVVLVWSGGISRLEARSARVFWRGLPLVATRNSAFGSLAVVGTPAGRSLYENGVVLFNVPDPNAAEEAVHYGLLQHPEPRSLLMIGGGLNGSIAQALRHPGLERVYYVELDPAILQLARDYMPKEASLLTSDPRVHVHVTDGRLFVKTTASLFDVIIINLPDPQTAQLNRFYTVEFFQEAARKLAANGVLSFRLTASENYIGPELAEFLQSIAQSLSRVFPDMTAIPGESVHFFAARRPGVLARDAEGLLSRLHGRHLATDYVSEYFLPFRMSPDRMRALERQLRPGPATPVNHDFAPIAYYFDGALWAGRFNAGYLKLFHALADLKFRNVVAGLSLLAVVLAVACRHWGTGKRRIGFTAAACTAAMGFTLIGLEILLLLAFQAIYGYVYQELAVLIGAFMAGMAAGSAVALRSQASRGLHTLVAVQVMAAVIPLALCGIFQWVAPVTSRAGLFAVSQVLFPTLALLCGMLGGYEYPIASRLFFTSAPNRGRGALYAFDLAGSSLGALAFSAYLLPVFGFLRTALLIAVVSLAPALLAIPPVFRTKRVPALAPERARRTPAQ